MNVVLPKAEPHAEGEITRFVQRPNNMSRHERRSATEARRSAILDEAPTDQEILPQRSDFQVAQEVGQLHLWNADPANGR